jgi:hypothetical protein
LDFKLLEQWLNSWLGGTRDASLARDGDKGSAYKQNLFTIKNIANYADFMPTNGLFSSQNGSQSLASGLSRMRSNA